MSILNVEHLSHGFGDRAIFQDVSFRLLKGEHIGLVGANGEGKSTFMSIITGKLQPDEERLSGQKHVARRLSGPAHRTGKGHDHPRCVKERVCVSV
ncbi:MAG: ATP-binding cassette domain-containing protein [Clostridium sp.]